MQRYRIPHKLQRLQYWCSFWLTKRRSETAVDNIFTEKYFHLREAF